MKGDDILGFAGIEPASAALLPVEQHFAEKIHAYSYPRDERPFSRIRDLVDLVLLIEQGLPDNNIVMPAIAATFNRRGTHDIPQKLEMPPGMHSDSYTKMAEDCGIMKKSMESAFNFIQGYWTDLVIRK